MAIKYCQLCGRFVSARRKIGVGTLILCLLTFGLWVLVIPLYSKRCPICLSDALTDSPPHSRAETSHLVGAPILPTGYKSVTSTNSVPPWPRKLGFWIGRHPIWTAALVL